MYNFSELNGAGVIVTGAARGIGKATARIFLEQGARVLISDLDSAALGEAQNDLPGVETCVCNITDRSQVDTMFATAVEKFGRVDVLVNNAGITQDGLFMRMKVESWAFILDVNLTGTFHCCQAAVNIMRKSRKGSIINLSSLARTGNPGQVNYSAAKAGVVGLTKALAKEVAPMGIRVNAIAPGYVETRLTQAIPEKMREEMVSRIPLRRKGAPEDIAGPVLFLASDLSSYVTGEVLNVTGGVGSL